MSVYTIEEFREKIQNEMQNLERPPFLFEFPKCIVPDIEDAEKTLSKWFGIKIKLDAELKHTYVFKEIK